MVNLGFKSLEKLQNQFKAQNRLFDDSDKESIYQISSSLQME